MLGCFTAFGHFDFDIVINLIRHGPQLQRMLMLQNTPGALLVHAHHLSRRQLRQMGHQYLGMPGAHVTPLLTQYYGDITDMTQTHATFPSWLEAPQARQETAYFTLSIAPTRRAAAGR
jgi:hypothetical protein